MWQWWIEGGESVHSLKRFSLRLFFSLSLSHVYKSSSFYCPLTKTFIRNGPKIPNTYAIYHYIHKLSVFAVKCVIQTRQVTPNKCHPRSNCSENWDNNFKVFVQLGWFTCFLGQIILSRGLWKIYCDGIKVRKIMGALSNCLPVSFYCKPQWTDEGSDEGSPQCPMDIAGWLLGKKCCLGGDWKGKEEGGC